MPGLPKNTVLEWATGSNRIVMTLPDNADPLDVFEWLRGEKEFADGLEDLINKTGSVCARGGVEKVHGMDQLVPGGKVPALITGQGDDWFEAETQNDKTFRFSRADLTQCDGPRWFEFDE